MHIPSQFSSLENKFPPRITVPRFNFSPDWTVDLPNLFFQIFDRNFTRNASFNDKSKPLGSSTVPLAINSAVKLRLLERFITCFQHSEQKIPVRPPIIMLIMVLSSWILERNRPKLQQPRNLQRTEFDFMSFIDGENYFNRFNCPQKNQHLGTKFAKKGT